ncbi:hypothetical protein MHTCC0001_19680 [Flavobacteriaceae bacterium MHTCC 0001]
MKKHALICSFFFLVFATGFSQPTKESLEKYKVLSQKVLAHFESQPKKKKAAQFLLRGMLNHGSANPQWIDKNKKASNLSEFKYESFSAAKHAFNAFIAQGGKQDIKFVRDLDQLTSDFLIKHIDYSFKTWEESPWYKSYSFDYFCEYVLPYRSSIEPLENNWKQKYAQLYKSALFTASDPKDPVSVCSELIKSVKHLQFINKRAYPQPMLSADQVHFRGQGNCTDLANTVLLLGRALGLGVTYDFTPYHAASSHSHYWNTVLDKDCNFIPFNGNGELPYVYNAATKRLGKVLRQTFSPQKEALATKVPSKQIPTIKLMKPNVIDVTEQYVYVSNVSYKFDEKIPNNIAYIAVFNKAKWQPTWWASTDANHNAIFKNMGRNIVYLPSKTKDTILHKVKRTILDLEKYAILLKSNGEQRLLKPDFKNTFNATISRANEETFGYNDFNTVTFKEDKNYTLYYWEGKWKAFKKVKSINASLSFKGLPKNALFKVLPDDPDTFERIFVIDPKTQKIFWY